MLRTYFVFHKQKWERLYKLGVVPSFEVIVDVDMSMYVPTDAYPDAFASYPPGKREKE